MSSLIIAEKPSLAKNIMSAIGQKGFQKHDGYYESPDYIVSWAYGHLFGLYDLEDYLPKDVRSEKPAWTLTGLPFCPRSFCFALRKNPKTNKVDVCAEISQKRVTRCRFWNSTCNLIKKNTRKEGIIMPKIIGQQEQQRALKDILAMLKDVSIINSFLSMQNNSGKYTIAFADGNNVRHSCLLFGTEKDDIYLLALHSKDNLRKQIYALAEEYRIALDPEEERLLSDQFSISSAQDASSPAHDS